MKTKSFLLAVSLLCAATTASSAQTFKVAQYQPWESLFFSEYLEALERHMGGSFEAVKVNSPEQRRQFIKEGKADFSWAVLSKENKKFFRWSKPIITSELSLIIRKSAGKRPADLKGKLICALPISLDESFVKSLGAKRLPCANPSQKLEKLLANRCVAMVGPIESNISIARAHPELKKTFKHYKKAVKPPMYQLAFVMNKSNKALQKQLNRAIQKTVEDGSYQDLLEKYMSTQQ